MSDFDGEIQAAEAEAKNLLLGLIGRIGLYKAQEIFRELGKPLPAAVLRKFHERVLVRVHESFVAKNKKWSVRKTAALIAQCNREASQMKEHCPPGYEPHLGPRQSTSVDTIDKYLRRLLKRKRRVDIST
jgi:hypothetical protein